MGGQYKMSGISELCRRFRPALRLLGRKSAMSGVVYCGSFLSVSSSPDRHSLRRLGLAAMGRRQCPKHGLRQKDLPDGFEPGQKRSDGSGIDLRTTCNVRWVAKLGTENYSSPVVAEGKVYVGTRRHFCVLAAGRQKRVLAEVRLGSQVRSTPAVADGVLYVASQRILWAVQLTKPHGLVSMPMHKQADHKSHT